MAAQEVNRQPKGICWDLENTVGRFDRIAYEMEGQAAPEWTRPTSLRYGIKELLADFSEANGYINYVTTAASSDFAKESLKRTGLSEFFRKVMGRDVISTGWGKHYEPVAKDLGYSHAEAQANMIVVVDAPGDSTIDIEGLVFVHLDNYYYDALVIREIFTSLLEAGNGNFRKGFDVYRSQAVAKRPEEELEFQERMVDLGNGISFEIKLDQLEIPSETGYGSGRYITVPMITNINAPEYIQEPVYQ